MQTLTIVAKIPKKIKADINLSEQDLSPRIKQGWLRALLACLILLLLTGFLAGIIALLGISILGVEKVKAGIQSKETFFSGNYLLLTTAVSFVAVLGTVWICRKYIDRRSIKSLGFKWQGHVYDAAAGFFVAIVALVGGTVLLIALNKLVWDDVAPNTLALMSGGIAMLLVAFGEELFFRGYLLQNFSASFNKWVALLLSSAVFAFFHISNSGFNFIACINLVLAGVLLGINYIYTGNLWFGIFLHWAWNFFEGPVLGFNVSGHGLNGLLEPAFKGEELITGGAFGFEASIICTLVIVLSSLALYFVYENKNRITASARRIS